MAEPTAAAQANGAGRIEAEISKRLAESLTQETLADAYRAARSEMRGVLDKHNRVVDHCGACSVPFPCPVVGALSRILRVPQLLLARATANAIAEEAKGHGAPVLTVLRRPELDVFSESIISWDTSREEQFGFEVVLPDTTVALRIPGGPRPHGRREYDQDDAVKQVRKAGERYGD